MKTSTPGYTCHQLDNNTCIPDNDGTNQDDISLEYSLYCQMMQARHSAGFTQAKLAEKIGTKASAVARMELALTGNKRYAIPTIATLKKYAQAVGCKLEIHLVPLILSI